MADGNIFPFLFFLVDAHLRADDRPGIGGHHLVFVGNSQLEFFRAAQESSIVLANTAQLLSHCHKVRHDTNARCTR